MGTLWQSVIMPNGKTGLKSSVYPPAHKMMYETIGFQGQGIQLCNQIYS